MGIIWGIYSDGKLLDNLGVWTTEEKAEEELGKWIAYSKSFKNCYVEYIKIHG